MNSQTDEIIYSSNDKPKIKLLKTQVKHNDREWTQHILDNNSESIGVVVIAVSKGKYLMNYHYRPAIENYLIEFPRGYGSHPSTEEDIEEVLKAASRELIEETGFTAVNSAILGYFYPDSGILKSKVAVVSVEVGRVRDSNTDGEVEMSFWVPSSQLKDMISTGAIRDGMTLTAYSIWREIYQRYQVEKMSKETLVDYVLRQKSSDIN